MPIERVVADDEPGEGGLPPVPRSTDFVIVTGMSGAGRSTAANVIEDRGWYVVDNLPPQLLSAMADLARRVRNTGVSDLRIAAVVDVRARAFTSELQAGLAALREAGWHPHLIFLDATDEALVRRFESVRRPHPLQGDGRLLDGIARERELMSDLRASAEVVIDTSHLNVHQLAAKVVDAFGEAAGPALRVTVMSFGFKYGLPMDADHVADVRFLPNPFWVPELRPRTGLDAAVRDYVLGQDGAEGFLKSYASTLGPLLPGYARENKRYVTVAVGCTGGKHRSVAMAEALAGLLRGPGVHASAVHRDLGRE